MLITGRHYLAHARGGARGGATTLAFRHNVMESSHIIAEKKTVEPTVRSKFPETFIWSEAVCG